MESWPLLKGVASLVAWSASSLLSKHMKKVDSMKGVREPQDFLGDLSKVHSIWQCVRGQSLD
jgi:hypothetical protein